MSVRATLAGVILLGTIAACGEKAGGPRSRIAQYTGCLVPGSAVQVDEEIRGVDTAETYARIVFETGDLPEFLVSCGISQGQLTRGFDASKHAPEPHLDWWRLPPPRWVDGYEDEHGAIIVLFRDTDVAVFLHHEGDHHR